MKKLFSLFVTILVTTSLWAYDFQSGELYYTITSSSEPYTVEVNDAIWSITIANIPETVTYNGTTYSVTSIGPYAFEYCFSLTSVTIGNSVTSIGDYAFRNCSSLTSVTIDNSVTSIGGWAFMYCSSLTAITIPNNVTNIDKAAFSSCENLATIIVENGNSVYDSRENCNAIIETATNTLIAGCQNTVIPNGVACIGFAAFENCRYLTAITIPNSVTSIEDWAFSRCSSLTSITIPNSVTSIGNQALSGTGIYNDQSNWENGVLYIDNCLISSNTTLSSSYSIKDGTRLIANSALSYQTSLTSITIPESVVAIGTNAFEGCVFLKTDFINKSSLDEETNHYWGAQIADIEVDGLLIRNDTVIVYRGDGVSVTIPNTITCIRERAFANCNSLTSITIPNSVTSIGGRAFYYCSSLTSVNIPNSVTSIGNDAFSYCSSLTSITIPNSVTSIGNGAFGGCSSLTSITIPNSVTSIGDMAFYYCSALKSITCEATIPPTTGNNTFYKKKSIPVYVPCGRVSAYKTASGWNEFINIQEPLAEYSIQVSTSNSQMGTAKVDYNNCGGAQISATPNIGYHFVQWNDGNTDNPRTLVLTEDITLTAEFAQSFSGQCGDNLYWSYEETTKTISITGSGKMYDYTVNTQPWILFKEDIKEVTICNKATSIGISAFEGCISLGKLSIGPAMKNIAANAFAECKRLYDIYTYATYPPFAEESSFANYNVDLYIPCESKRDYEYDIVWGKFKFIECIGAESEPVVPDTVIVTPGTNDVTITWPTDKNADTYSIEIKRGDVVFCTLTFSKDGMLTNIAFAPSRSGSHPVTYAASTGNGLRFTVTSLDAATTYGYNVTTKDEEDNTLSTYSGEFTTKGGTTTDMDNIQSPVTTCQKVMRNGQLIILRNGKEYNAMGQEIQ